MILKTFEQFVNEGVYDQGILKAVFMAGGSGSGKSFIAADLFGIADNVTRSVSSTGMKVVNADHAFEYLLKQSGFSPKHIKDMPEELEKAFLIRGLVRKSKFQAMYTKARLGMIIDVTGGQFGLIRNQREALEEMGYDTMLIFVNTSLETAKKRNLNRDRILPDERIEKSYNTVQKFKKDLLGISDNHIVVDNDTDSKVSSDIQKQVNKFVRKPVESKVGKEWIRQALELKKRI